MEAAWWWLVDKAVLLLAHIAPRLGKYAMDWFAKRAEARLDKLVDERVSLPAYLTLIRDQPGKAPDGSRFPFHSHLTFEIDPTKRATTQWLRFYWDKPVFEPSASMFRGPGGVLPLKRITVDRYGSLKVQPPPDATLLQVTVHSLEPLRLRRVREVDRV